MRGPRPGARARRIGGTLLAAALLAGLTACAGAGAPAAPSAAPSAAPTPAATATPDPFPVEPLTPSTRYVALGDSYAAGMGAGEEKGKCRQSPENYPAVFARKAGIDLVLNASCAGATTSDLLAHQLLSLDDRTDLVTVSVGGNDLGVAAIASDCAAQKAVACRDEVTAALSLLNVLPDRLDAVYKAVAEAAPNARIVVTGYALMWDANPSSPDFATAAAINAATISLNQIIEQAVDQQRQAGVPMVFIAPDFAGHAVNDSDPWLNVSGPDAFHPTAKGYSKYAAALVKLLGTAQ